VVPEASLVPWYVDKRGSDRVGGGNEEDGDNGGGDDEGGKQEEDGAGDR